MTLLTVVMPIYNGGDLLDAAITNVRDQTHRELEIFILDNCSNDGSYEVAKKHADEDNRIEIIRRSENIGATANFMDGFTHGKSSLIVFRAHDDFSSLDYFERLVALLDRTPDLLLAVGAVEQLWPDGRLANLQSRFKDVQDMALGAPAAWFYGVWKREYLRHKMDKLLKTYPYIVAFDLLLLYGAIVTTCVACDPNAVFTQRKRSGMRSYMTPDRMTPLEQWRFRSIFKSHCKAYNATLPIRDRFRFALLPHRFTERRARKLKQILRAAVRK